MRKNAFRHFVAAFLDFRFAKIARRSIPHRDRCPTRLGLDRRAVSAQGLSSVPKVSARCLAEREPRSLAVLGGRSQAAKDRGVSQQPLRSKRN
jgi:hypothetical protein